MELLASLLELEQSEVLHVFLSFRRVVSFRSISYGNK
jgi:hypothetical protein